MNSFIQLKLHLYLLLKKKKSKNKLTLCIRRKNSWTNSEVIMYLWSRASKLRRSLGGNTRTHHRERGWNASRICRVFIASTSPSVERKSSIRDLGSNIKVSLSVTVEKAGSSRFFKTSHIFPAFWQLLRWLTWWGRHVAAASTRWNKSKSQPVARLSLAWQVSYWHLARHPGLHVCTQPCF